MTESRIEMGARLLSESIMEEGTDIDNLGDGESIVVMDEMVSINLHEVWSLLERKLEEAGYEIVPISGGR